MLYTINNISIVLVIFFYQIFLYFGKDVWKDVSWSSTWQCFIKTNSLASPAIMELLHSAVKYVVKRWVRLKLMLPALQSKHQLLFWETSLTWKILNIVSGRGCWVWTFYCWQIIGLTYLFYSSEYSIKGEFLIGLKLKKHWYGFII